MKLISLNIGDCMSYLSWRKVHDLTALMEQCSLFRVGCTTKTRFGNALIAKGDYPIAYGGQK